MNVNGVDRIVFRFSRREVAALLWLMSLRSLPELELDGAAPGDDTIESLVGGGVAMPVGERTLVDATIALVLGNMSRSERRIRVQGPKGSMALYRGEGMYVLAMPVGELVTLEPLQNREAAWTAMQDALERLGEPLELRGGPGGENRCESATEALRALYERIEWMEDT